MVQWISSRGQYLFQKIEGRQQNINESLFKNRTNEVDTYLARWVYESGIPFNSINNDAFRQFVEVVGQFGPGYIPPSISTERAFTKASRSKN